MWADGLAFPIGMAISADGATLIVAESCVNRLTAYDTWTRRRSHVGGRSRRPSGRDLCGLRGAVWYADVGSRRCVRVRERGEFPDIVSLVGLQPQAEILLCAAP